MRAFLILLLFPAFVQAQLQPVKLTVDPAVETRPALRYELLPSARDRVPGNAMLHYLKAAAAKPPIERDLAKSKAEWDLVLVWEEAKIDKFPVKEVAEYLQKYKSLFRELEYATRCKQCDWTSAPTNPNEAIGDRLGEVQTFREFARLLSLRYKLELAEKRTDDALRTIQTGLQMGRHIGECPTLIFMLVRIAIDNIFLGCIDTFLEQPDAPNLYWALSTLPKPFLDPRPGLDGEDQLNESFFPGLVELRKGPVAPERALELTLAAMKNFGGEPITPGLADIAIRLELFTRAKANDKEARKELLSRGHNPDDVAAMPSVQVVFLNSFERYRDVADDYRKWFLLGGPDAAVGIEKMSDRVKKLKVDTKEDRITQNFLNVLPAIEKVYYTLARTERRIALLRTVEAIRIHTALTTQLPKELADIKKVPVPNDPLTDKPFEYSVVDGGFTLTAPEVKNPEVKNLLRQKYEVTLRIKK